MSYEGHRERQGDKQRQQSRSGRDIGPVPAIGNVSRRARCRSSLRRFCEVYNPEAFSLAWSEDHLRAIARLEEAATRGALYAFAMPRGSGKSTLSRMAALWALSYRHCRYVFTIGANLSKAREAMEAVKTWVRFLPLYVADFPEITHPVLKLAGIAQRAVGQLSEGAPTLIEWSQDRVILPTVKPPANWPKSWKLRGDGYVPTSGAALSAAGLTSDGIRGSLLTLSTGETIRPDLVLLDDPQTPESAVSPAQNAKRERLISADVLGMAGPGRSISAVMPCTVIAPNDMVDRILSRTLHPLWRGERTKLLSRMPESLAHWDAYLDEYRRCAQLEPPDFDESNAYYRAHQVEIETGSEASWPERKLPWEVSAIQHAIHLYARGPEAFFSEYQNAPRPPAQAVEGLTSDQITAKVARTPRGEVPLECQYLTAGIDIQGDLLYWLVAAWSPDFTGRVIDYGAFPDQNRPYFTLGDARPTLGDLYPSAGPEGAIYAGLAALAEQVLARPWRRQDGAEMRVGRALVDANWGSMTDLIYQFCRESAYASVLTPSHGRYVGISSKPLGEYRRSPGDQTGLNWRMPAVQGRRAVRHCLFDSNWWKTFVHARLAVAIGDRGSLTLWGERPDQHRCLADHLTAETSSEMAGRGRTVREWKLRPERPDNHWLDCLVQSAVAASILGAALPSLGGAAQPPRLTYREFLARRSRSNG